MRPWTKSYPDRLRYEVAEFERRGLGFKPDNALLEQANNLVIRGSVVWREQEIELVIAYPDSFPFLRPEVYAPQLTLDRHQNPIERNLCLLDRSSRAWHVSDTGAWLVTERVPHLLDLLEAGGETLLEGEAPQGEPASCYFQGPAGAVVFLPEEMLEIPDEYRVGILDVAFGEHEPPQQLLRACLARITVRNRKGKRHTLAEGSEPLLTRFGGRRLEGRWARLEQFPSGNEPLDLLNAITTAQPGLGQHHWQSLGDGVAVSIVGAVVQEEVRQGEREDTWLFLVSLRPPGGGNVNCYIARGERLTRDDLVERLPAGSRLQDKRLGLAGLGALGGPLATELLRAQVGALHVLDGDRVEVGNTVRWPFGISAVGYEKAGVIAGWGSNEHPFTETKGFIHRIGSLPPAGVAPPGAPTETEILNKFFEELDLVIDATAELGVQHLLSTLADEARIPQIYAWGTEGGWGGMVARVIPGSTGCWYCLQLALADGTIPLPPGARAATVQPRGCAAPTFVAASYALTPIVAQTVRVVVRTLRGHGADDVFVCRLEDPDGELPAPNWAAYPLRVHERCPCGHEAAAM